MGTVSEKQKKSAKKYNDKTYDKISIIVKKVRKIV